MQNTKHTVVSSKERMLTPPEIITYAVAEQNTTDIPTDRGMLMVAQELSMPGVDMVQIGNTVFIGHVNPKRKELMWGRALNVDTGRNFISNGSLYIAYLQNKGIELYTTTFANPQYLTAFQYWSRLKGDTYTDVIQNPEGDYTAIIKIGKQPIRDFMRK